MAISLEVIPEVIESIAEKLDNLEVKVDNMQATLDTVLSAVNRAVGLELTDLQRSKAMAVDIDELTNAVKMTKDATASAVTLIEGIAAQLREAADDEDEVHKLADDIESHAEALSAAITANTPHKPSGM